METYSKTLGEVMEAGELKLPVGYNREGKIIRDIEIGYMTGEVDAKIVDPKVRNNAGKVISEVVSSVVKSLGGNPKFDVQQARRMYVADREFIIAVNYYQSIAEDVEGDITWEEHCPNCKVEMELAVRLKDIKVHYLKEGQDTIKTVILPHGVQHEGKMFKEVMISLPNGSAQEKVNQTLTQDPGEAVTQILAEITETIVGLDDYNRDTFRNLIKKDRNALSKAMDEISLGPDFRTQCTCPSCGLQRKTQIPFMTLLGE